MWNLRLFKNLECRVYFKKSDKSALLVIEKRLELIQDIEN
ncbi:hypothetical protein LEP1GSC193_1266 [Leptospira alstonii serovar Pingchang str. 80-412]|uniref:Uncharacterized protein n=2 Tax=Leptospira alstonii TaxID=28452 RepID=M6CJC8_9LEPT|nr:hypothetical protein LEP1GSC194_0041 [Leptospira alstonii serovar Sichuan str. 79601]EQA78554.1 hypothetical protein LEP1GSC193_1266 [Leptospira alstonii serovar Pingchang str. 80-412]